LGPNQLHVGTYEQIRLGVSRDLWKIPGFEKPNNNFTIQNLKPTLLGLFSRKTGLMHGEKIFRTSIRPLFERHGGSSSIG
jgi:hypothetical protein